MILLLYIFLYCNADNILNNLYLSYYSATINNELLQDNTSFYYSIINQNIFAVSVYSVYIINNYMRYNSINNDYYTELANRYDDKTIFQMLYSVYTLFDNIIKKYPHLQKIETIGDAYMVVGDIFRNSVNYKRVVEEIILFAVDIIKEIKTIKTPDDKPLSIRVGINMGDISVGILGNEIPRLCVVGNTVNMAARLQTTADVDTIQLSSDIFEEFENINFHVKFNVIKKDNVFLKNIGSVTTYNIQPNFGS